MHLAPLDEVSPAEEDPRLRSTEELVAADQDEVASFPERARRRHLLGEPRGKPQSAAPEIVQERDSPLASEPGKLGDLRLLGEADQREIRAVHAQDEPARTLREGVERSRVV